MTRYCFDTDVISAMLRPVPPMDLVRRVAAVRPEDQTTSAITAGELLYGAARKGSPQLTDAVRAILDGAMAIVPFDAAAASVYGHLRAGLEADGRRLAEPDLRIASIALANGLTLVTGNVRHFARVGGLEVQDWLRPNA